MHFWQGVCSCRFWNVRRTSKHCAQHRVGVLNWLPLIYHSSSLMHAFKPRARSKHDTPSAADHAHMKASWHRTQLMHNEWQEHSIGTNDWIWITSQSCMVLISCHVAKFPTVVSNYMHASVSWDCTIWPIASHTAAFPVVATSC